MSWNNVKISKILEHNISHPRKAAATKTAALSDMGFSGRGELNKYLCNLAKKNLHRLMAVSWAFRVTWLHRMHQLSSQLCAVPHGMTDCSLK